MKKNLTVAVMSFLLVSVYANNISAQVIGTTTPTVIYVTQDIFTTGYLHSIPYINFTAQVTNANGGPASFYPSWTPDGNGTRPYDFVIFNNPTSQTVSFDLTTTESNNPCYADTRLWTRVNGNYVHVDDDHGSNTNFGAKIILNPGASFSAYITMYSSSSSPKWFAVAAYKAGNGGFKNGYAIVTCNQNQDPVIVNQN